MKKQMEIQIRGKNSTWSVCEFMSDEKIDAMRADGIELFGILNTIPMWIADAGLSHIWCFFEDIYNFRNPFQK